uniref:Ig-like domain-containing protein n=1 Tax=uncultured Roseovarius sp. TaxID=293344 RepID=UPI002615AA11
VANTSRNITFSSEDGEASAVHHRGHVMFMHNDDVDVRYAAFDDLGRTDKSNPAFHVSDLDPATIEADTNVQARYSLHMHRTGTDDQENPAIAMGNSVSGSPGWGYVHHSSHAEFIQNVAFDVFGAAFVAEDGDETGLWLQNMAIKTEGVGYSHIRTKSGEDVRRDDVGKTGDGFWFGSRSVEATENIAANTTHGFTWMMRASDQAPDPNLMYNSDAYYGRSDLSKAALVPIQGFHDNEAFGTQVGLIVVKATKWQNHDVRSVMDGFTNWETSDGVQMTYTSHYTLKNFDLLATTNPDGRAGAGTGFEFGASVFDMAVNGLSIEGFRTGIDLDQRFGADWTDDDLAHILIDLNLVNNDVDMDGFNPSRHTLLSSKDLVEGRLEFVMAGKTVIGEGDSLVFDGIKTDSVGSHDRQFAADIQDLSWGIHIKPLLQRDGYFETDNGENVMLINDYVADRATGQLLKFAHVITLDISDERLAKLGITNNGHIDLNSKAPIARDDSVRAQSDTAIVIDPLANDFDPDGQSLHISEFTNPFHANLTLRDDGTLLYEPHQNVYGIDSFDYWVADENGMLS